MHELNKVLKFAIGVYSIVDFHTRENRKNNMFAPKAPLIRSRIDMSTVLAHTLLPQTILLTKLPWDLGHYVRTVIQMEKPLTALGELP